MLFSTMATLAVSCALVGSSQAHANPPMIATERSLVFYSDPLLNLHHVLHAAARKGLPSPLDAPMTAEARRAWDQAVAFYARDLASRDLRIGKGMIDIRQALAAGDMSRLAADHRAVFEAALPVYKQYFWSDHDRSNREWTADVRARFRQVAPALIPRLERVLATPWPSQPVRVDIVWVAKPTPYSTLDPLYVAMGSTDPLTREWHGVELLLHEVTHGLIFTVEEALSAALKKHGRTDDVWHAALFYITGATLRETLAARGERYEPYLYSTGLFARAWPSIQTALETHLQAYLDGALTLPDAADRIAASPPRPRPDRGSDRVQAQGPVAEVAKVRFHSDVWMNLHHTLFAAAWARRPEAETLRALAGPLPAPLEAPFTPEERSAWTAAVDYYDKNLASRDLLFGRGMMQLKAALVAGDLASEAVGKELRAVLESAAPIYRRHFWSAHDRANRAWIAATADPMKAIAPAVIPRLETLYGVKWFTSPVRADVVWVANRQGAYTTDGPPAHATISSSDGSNTGWSAVETVFHEYSHVLILPIQEKLERALGDRIKQHGILWHVVQFYITGAVVREVLKARGIEYTPLVYSAGLFDRAWGRYRTPVETNWQPYVDGKVTLDEAIAGTLKMLQ